MYVGLCVYVDQRGKVVHCMHVKRFVYMEQCVYVGLCMYMDQCVCTLGQSVYVGLCKHMEHYVYVDQCVCVHWGSMCTWACVCTWSSVCAWACVWKRRGRCPPLCKDLTHSVDRVARLHMQGPWLWESKGCLRRL